MGKTYQNKIVIAKTVQQVRDAAANNKLVALVGMENAYPLGNICPDQRVSSEVVHFCDVQTWAEQGVRYMGITHFGHNQFGDSSNPHPDRDDGPRHNGLSSQGKELINQLNRHGIMVDVSHAGKETMMQAADLSRTPIIASHSGVKAIADTARNLDDEQLRKLKDVSGVAQMVALGSYVKILTPEQEAFRDTVRTELGLETSEARSAMTDEKEAVYEKRLEGMYDIEPRATVADFVDHIDHAVKIAGIDHVGIASDFDGGGGIVGWQDASETENVTAELIKRGYSEDEIAKIWGGNLLRVLEAVEAGKK
jgi:membrane dipeptidase